MPKRCRICSHPDIESINRAIAAGHTFKQIAAQFPELFANRPDSFLTDHRPHVLKRRRRRTTGKRLNPQAIAAEEIENLREVITKANQSGKIRDAIDGHSAMARYLGLLQPTGEKGGNGLAETPALTIVFRSPEEIEAARVEARSKILALEPDNAVIREQDQAASEIVPEPAAAPTEQAAQSTPENKNLATWAAFGEIV